MITGYMICQAVSSKELEAKVIEAIQQGWQPYGPLVINLDVIDEYIQPMVQRRTSDIDART